MTDVFKRIVHGAPFVLGICAVALVAIGAVGILFTLVSTNVLFMIPISIVVLIFLCWLAGE